jgi:hypothetical protein
MANISSCIPFFRLGYHPESTAVSACPKTKSKWNNLWFVRRRRYAVLRFCGWGTIWVCEMVSSFCFFLMRFFFLKFKINWLLVFKMISIKLQTKVSGLRMSKRKMRQLIRVRRWFFRREKPGSLISSYKSIVSINSTLNFWNNFYNNIFFLFFVI